MTKRQEYRLLRTYEDFEIREYQPCVIAEVKVSTQYSDAASAGFSPLFKYISQGNKRSEKIAMTAPVITTQVAVKEDSDQWFVSFVMPSGSTFGHLPHPNDPQVKLRDLEEQTCAVLSFRGKATDELVQKKVRELRRAAGRENIALSSETRICRFDPPFKPGFMQYNEIVIPSYSWD
jgi:hypothetical protein